jgi:hypothetical protein
MTVDILEMLKDLVDSSPERVAGPVVNGRKVRSHDGLNNLLDESFLDVLDFTEEADCFVMSRFLDCH